jgi:hypothetical protein
MVERSAAVTAGTSLPDESSQSPETSSTVQQTLVSTWVSGRLHANELNHGQVSSADRHEVQKASLSSGEQTLVKLQILKQHKERKKHFQASGTIDRWALGAGIKEARRLVIW